MRDRMYLLDLYICRNQSAITRVPAFAAAIRDTSHPARYLEVEKRQKYINKPPQFLGLETPTYAHCSFSSLATNGWLCCFYL